MSLAKVVAKVKTHTQKSEGTTRLSEFGPRRFDATRLMQSRVNPGRYRRLLYSTACLVLNGCEGAKEALQNCLLRASYNPSRFANEGAFRSWLIRILIDEALLVLQKRRNDMVIRYRASDIAPAQPSTS